MFYRMKFDGVVGRVLGAAGYRSTSEKLAVWPAGLTPHLVAQGKQLKIGAKLAAYIGIAKYFAETPEIPLEVRTRIIKGALNEALADSNLDNSIISTLQGALEKVESY